MPAAAASSDALAYGFNFRSFSNTLATPTESSSKQPFPGRGRMASGFPPSRGFSRPRLEAMTRFLPGRGLKKIRNHLAGGWIPDMPWRAHPKGRRFPKKTWLADSLRRESYLIDLPYL